MAEELTETPTNQEVEISPEARKQHKQFKFQLDTCKQYRRKLVADWQVNVDYRRGKPFASQSDEDRVSVPLDWGLTKGKEAQLFGQVPAVRINHPPQTTSDEALPWLHSFENKINDIMTQAGVESAMSEVLPDVINAAGFGVVITTRDAITRDEMLPAADLSQFPEEIQAQIMQTKLLPDGSELPMVAVPRVLDSKYSISRISPADFLWPLSFTGSDFNLAPWLGRSGRISWPEALRRFKKLTPEEKDAVVGASRGLNNTNDTISNDIELKKEDSSEEIVSFDELFYKEYYYNKDATSYASIHHLRS